jgi:hypothetical protein
MYVIFLDIDGVLNVISQGYDNYGSIFHQHLVDNLKTIIDKTGAYIVISSSWRTDGLDKLRLLWKSRNYPGQIISTTPLSYFNEDLESNPNIEICRGHEIQYWLKNHPEVTNYVILDDDNDILESQLDHFVQTSENPDHEDSIDIGYGLTKQCAKKAINILNNESLIK